MPVKSICINAKFVLEEEEMEKRAFNFAAGPSTMPEEVLEKAKEELLCYPGAGCSVMEMSHRSKEYQNIIDRAEASIRRLMNISDAYAVLFLQGGATTQFSMVPMNLMHQGETACYINSGNFANKARLEAMRWGNAIELASSKDSKYTYIPRIGSSDIPKDAKYLHITGNNTIFGTSYSFIPEHGNIPLVADWSSAILGKEINVNDYDLIYAGAQKNIGPAGLTVVIVKKDVLIEPDSVVPVMLRYKEQIESGSMYNTPPCYSIYMSGLIFDWVERQGGVSEMQRRNLIKSEMLYDLIDNSMIYTNPVAKEDRSITNVVFTLPSDELTASFIAKAREKNIINIKGHKLVGGLRASIYNGMSIEGVEYLADFMKKFEKENE